MGRGLEHKSLILPTLYRTVVFSVWVGVFNLLEATVRGLLDRQGLLGGFEEIASKGRYELLAGCRRDVCGLHPLLRLQGIGTGAGGEQTPGPVLEARDPG